MMGGNKAVVVVDMLCIVVVAIVTTMFLDGLAATPPARRGLDLVGRREEGVSPALVFVVGITTVFIGGAAPAQPLVEVGPKTLSILAVGRWRGVLVLVLVVLVVG
jgi:hypothetical protein